MKILITIPWFFPAYKAGGPIQSIANMVTALESESMQFLILCGDADLQGEKLTGIKPDRWIDYSLHTKVCYCSGGRVRGLFLAALKEYRPDAIFVNGIYSWRFTLIPLLFGNKVRKVISARGMLHPEALKQKRFKKQVYLSVFKLLRLHKKSVFHATDEQEKKFIQQQFGIDCVVKVATNFPREINFTPVQRKQTGELKLLTVALISAMKNYREVLNSLKIIADNGRIAYKICGPVKDKHYWDECQQLIKNISPAVSVEYLGELSPQQIPLLLADCDVFILPSRSENFGHALFEALSAGRPVITSYGTPWKNLQEAMAGINVDMAAGNHGLEKAISYFLEMENEVYQNWSRGARAFSENALDKTAVRQQYLELFAVKPTGTKSDAP